MTNQQYQQEIDWLFLQAPNYQNIGANAYKPGLENIKQLCAFFGNPQQALRMIHIAGTNGKGSTSSMTASVLQEAGYKVGLYTSPHLTDFRERIKINGEKCSREFVYQFIKKLRALPSEIQPSFFEFTTVMAFEYFRQKQVDIAVIEVGLGGRLDATNIIKPLLTAITNISLDHQNLLGDTEAAIAAEKAGIIKTNIPIVCGEEDPEIRQLIQEIAKEREAPFVDATVLKPDYKTDLQGSYQSKNIKVACALIHELRSGKWQITESAIQKGLEYVQKNTGLVGRWTVVSRDPLTICDTAHNAAGMRAVFSQLNGLEGNKHLVLGFVDDKKIEQIVPLFPGNSEFYFSKPQVSRGRDPRSFEEILKKSKIIYNIFDSVQEAYLAAKQRVQKGDLIFVGGSNFVVGEFLEKNLEN